MKRPPAIANALLTRFVLEDAALVGDIYEQWTKGQSRAWFWRQTVSAILCRTYVGSASAAATPRPAARRGSASSPIARALGRSSASTAASPSRAASAG